MESKKDAFRKYLEGAGVIDSITKGTLKRGDARDSANVDEEGILEQASSLGARKHLERASAQDARRACPRVRMLTTMRATPRHAACIPRVVDDAQLW